jgi:predicted nucleic acid-binding protein
VTFVVDASVVLAWNFEDEVSEYADRVLDRLGVEGALAPSIWALEMANALLMAERRGRLTPARTAQAARLLTGLPVDLRDLTLGTTTGIVLDLAREHGLSTYDAAYLELAMREGLPLATEDGGLRSAAKRAGVGLIS